MRRPLRKQRSRYERARTALRDMMPSQNPRPAAVAAEESGDSSGLHWMTAGLFLAAGAEAAFGERRGDYRPPDALRWAPLVAAPLAIAAQAARAISPSRSTRIASQIANAVAVTVGAAGLISSVNSARHLHQYDVEYEPSLLETLPSLAPLAFGAVGVLGLLLDSEERGALPPTSRTRKVRAIRIKV